MFKLNEKGQGLVEYAIILVLVAVVVIVVLALLAAACLWIPAVAAALFAFWQPVSTAGTALVAGLMAGDPKSIFVVAVIGIVLAFVIFGRRRS